MSLTNLRAALSPEPKDQFRPGSVISWKHHGLYTAAIRDGVSWNVTNEAENLTWDELIRLLKRPGTTDVVLASEWTTVEDWE